MELLQGPVATQGRQKDFVDTEKSLGRKGENVSAVVGYAGGPKQGAAQASICISICRLFQVCLHPSCLTIIKLLAPWTTSSNQLLDKAVDCLLGPGQHTKRVDPLCAT